MALAFESIAISFWEGACGTPPPGNLHGQQNRRVAARGVCIRMKAKGDYFALLATWLRAFAILLAGFSRSAS